MDKKNLTDIRPLISALAQALGGEVEQRGHQDDHPEGYPDQGGILLTTGTWANTAIYLRRDYNSNKVTAAVSLHGVPSKAWNQYHTPKMESIGFDANKVFARIHDDIVKRLLIPNMPALAQARANMQDWLDSTAAKEAFRDSVVAKYPGLRVGHNDPFYISGTDPMPYFNARIQRADEMSFERLTLTGAMLHKVLAILAGTDVAPVPAEIAGSARFRCQSAGWRIAQKIPFGTGLVNYQFQKPDALPRWIYGTDDEAAAWQTLCTSERL